MKGEKDTALTDRQAYEWASVSTTQISNNTSDCGYHTPLTPRSATRPGIPLVSSASLTTGSVPPLCMLVLQYLPGHPSVHCVSVLLICAFLTIEGMPQAELSATAITTSRHSQEGPTIPHCQCISEHNGRQVKLDLLPLPSQTCLLGGHEVCWEIPRICVQLHACSNPLQSGHLLSLFEDCLHCNSFCSHSYTGFYLKYIMMRMPV